MKNSKEQEETIERLNRFKAIEILYGNTFAMHVEQLKTVQGDIETVLSMLQEQQEENKKKDKIIEEMAKEMFYENNRNVEKQHFQKIEEIIKYFKRRIK